MATIERRRKVGGNTAYYAKIRIKGHPVQHASFHRLTDARRWVHITEAAIREGRHFNTSEAKKHTLADAIERYVEEVIPKKTGSDSQNFQLEWWKEKIGGYSLTQVTPSLIAECREKLLREPIPSSTMHCINKSGARRRKPATVVRYLAALSHLFSIAIKEWHWCDDNPARKVTKPKEPRGRVRFLPVEERDSLLKACLLSTSKVLYLIVVLAISTGMRKGELMNLRWNQIDFDRSAITLHETKNGDRRNVPLAGLAHKLLQEHGRVRRIDSDLIFPGTNSEKPVELKRPWLSALKAAGILDFRFHDLRHCTASYLAMNGATMMEIAAVLGHKTLSMVKRYSHIADSHSAKVVTAMNQKIFGKEAA